MDFFSKKHTNLSFTSNTDDLLVVVGVIVATVVDVVESKKTFISFICEPFEWKIEWQIQDVPKVSSQK